MTSWDKEVLALYDRSDAPRIISDINALMRGGGAIRPQAVYNNDAVWPMPEHWQRVHLRGVVPFRFHGNVYQCPVRIVIMPGYPRVPPVPYVTPVEGMAVSTNHKHVDVQGRCYLPYLSSWAPQHSHLVGVVNALSQAFQDNPPVYTKPKTQPASQPQPQPQPQYQQQQQQYQQQQQQQQQQYQQYQQYQPATREDPKVLVRKLQAQAEERYVKWVRMFNDKWQEESRKAQLLESNATAVRRDVRSLIKAKEEFLAGMLAFDQCEPQFQSWKAQQQMSQSEIDIDSLLRPGDARSAQLLDLVAEDQAILDTFYWLDKALENDVIQIDAWLKAVRALGKEQFMKRALVLKIVAASAP